MSALTAFDLCHDLAEILTGRTDPGSDHPERLQAALPMLREAVRLAEMPTTPRAITAAAAA